MKQTKTSKQTKTKMGISINGYNYNKSEKLQANTTLTNMGSRKTNIAGQNVLGLA